MPGWDLNHDGGERQLAVNGSGDPLTCKVGIGFFCPLVLYQGCCWLFVRISDLGNTVYHPLDCTNKVLLYLGMCHLTMA